MALIEVENLVKVFRQQKQQSGLGGAFMTLFSRRGSEVKRAVDGISFAVQQGELVGYIGPNGAGKSTTIKMLTGILVPTSGSVIIDGLVPHERRKENARKIGAVFGQRSQLWWDLPIGETYNLIRYMYGVGRSDYEERIRFLKELLGLDEFWGLPVRQLSLGQRMRAEMGAALIHRPKILYLDEPTIGMDALVKARIRQFLTDINRRDGTTVILTTHDLEEVERTCSRVMVINYGKILFDGTLDELRAHCKADSLLIVEFEEEPPPDGFGGFSVVERNGRRVSFAFRRQELSASRLIEEIIGNYEVKDIAIKEPPIDAVVKELYEVSDRTQEGVSR